MSASCCCCTDRSNEATSGPMHEYFNSEDLLQPLSSDSASESHVINGLDDISILHQILETALCMYYFAVISDWRALLDLSFSV